MKFTRRPRILCLEDDEDTITLLTVILSAFDVIVAPTIRQALDAAENSSFDLYLIDNWLTDGTGVDFCRKFRATDRHTPILFLSAAANTSDLEEGISAGANNYLTKPVDPQDLVRAVELLLGARLIRSAATDGAYAQAEQQTG